MFNHQIDKDVKASLEDYDEVLGPVPVTAQTVVFKMLTRKDDASMTEKEPNVAERIKSLRKIIRKHLEDLDAFGRQIPDKFRMAADPGGRFGEVAVVGHDKFFTKMVRFELGKASFYGIDQLIRPDRTPEQKEAERWAEMHQRYYSFYNDLTRAKWAREAKAKEEAARGEELKDNEVLVDDEESEEFQTDIRL